MFILMCALELLLLRWLVERKDRFIGTLLSGYRSEHDD